MAKQSLLVSIGKDKEKKRLIMKSQPYFSIILHTNQENILPKQQKQNLQKSECYEKTREYRIINTIPFGTDSDLGKKNIYLLLIVMFSSVILGVVAFSYWKYLLRGNIPDKQFASVVWIRSVYLTIFFMLLAIVFSFILYEWFTAGIISTKWFNARRRNNLLNQYVSTPTVFYDFLMNKRIFLTWAFLIFWMAVVILTSIVLSKRSDRLSRKNIVISLVSVMALLIAQYTYFKSKTNFTKNASIAMSVFVIGLVVFLLYGL